VPVVDFRKISGRYKPYAKDQMRSRHHRQAAEFSARRSLIQGVIILKTRAQVEGMSAIDPLVPTYNVETAVILLMAGDNAKALAIAQVLPSGTGQRAHCS